MMAPEVDNVSVVVPSPSPDIASYRPFPEEFERIVDGILSEEASLEESPAEEEDSWHTSFASFNANIKSASSFTPVNPKETTPNPRKRSRVATRKITIVDMDDDNPDEQTVDTSTHVLPDSHVTDAYSTGAYAERPKTPDPVAPTPTTHTETENAYRNDAIAEEGIIFASVGKTEHVHLLDFISNHQFVQEAHQPVKSSVRREFVKELRSEAITAGMPDKAIFGLVDYVRHIYLQLVGVDPEPVTYHGDIDAIDGITFGTEIDDIQVMRQEPTKPIGFSQNMIQHISSDSNSLCQERHKRNLSGTDHADEAAFKKRKDAKQSARVSTTQTQLDSELSDSSLPVPLGFVRRKQKNKRKLDNKRRNKRKSELPAGVIENHDLSLAVQEPAPEEPAPEAPPFSEPPFDETFFNDLPFEKATSNEPAPEKPAPVKRKRKRHEDSAEQRKALTRKRAVEHWGEGDTSALWKHVQSSNSAREISKIISLKTSFTKVTRAVNQSMIDRLGGLDRLQNVTGANRSILMAKHLITRDFKQAHQLLAADPSMGLEDIDSHVLAQLGLFIDPASGLLTAELDMDEEVAY